MSHANARREDLIIQQVEADTVVYDQLRDRAHSLGPVAGFVFRHADGSRSVDELAQRLQSELGLEADQKVVEAALWELERADLLQPDADAASTNLISRREAVRRFGTATLAIAAVTSIAAPTPAMAKSNGNLGGPKKPKKPKNAKPPKPPKPPKP